MKLMHGKTLIKYHLQRGSTDRYIYIDILSTSTVRHSTDQRAVTEKPRVFVSHDDGAGQRPTQIDMINDSNSKLVSNLGNAISHFQKETSLELGCGLGYLASVIKDHYSDEA